MEKLILLASTWNCELCELSLFLSLSEQLVPSVGVALNEWVELSLPFHRDFALCKQRGPGVGSPDISLLFVCIPFMALTASLVARMRLGGARVWVSVDSL